MSIDARHIYHIENFPPLDGDEEKNRFVLVLRGPNADGLIPVVGITTKPDFAKNRIAIPIPSRATVGSHCTTGLSQASWALPDWLVNVHESRFPPKAKSTQPLDKITFATVAKPVVQRIRDGFPKIKDFGVPTQDLPENEAGC